MKYIPFLEVLVFLTSLSLFGAILLFGIPTDIQLHAAIIQNITHGLTAPRINFLYYLAVWVVSLFNTATICPAAYQPLRAFSECVPLYLASAIVLSLSVVAKFTVSRLAAVEYYRSTIEDDDAPAVTVTIGTLLLLVAFSLPASTMYLGQIPPNVWHNSTVIFLMPFALALFWLSYHQLLQPTTRRLLIITLLCGLNVLIKPSFVMVFGIAYPVMLLMRFGIRRQFWWNLLPLAATSVMIVVQYYLMYELSVGYDLDAKSGIALQPFVVWSHFSPNIVRSLCASLVFPVVYLACYWKDAFKHELMRYALIAYSVSVVMASLLTETGPRQFDANFFWQAIICSYILFFVSMVHLSIKLHTFRRHAWRNSASLCAFMLHVAAGVRYLVYLIQDKSFG